MLTSTTLNKPEISRAATKRVIAHNAGRPVSLGASLGVLAASLYISHVGLVAVFGAGELAGVMTFLLFCLSTLQWMSMGRARNARAAGAASQWLLTLTNATGMFVLESTLNTIGVVQLAAKSGSDWGPGTLAFAGAIAIAVVIAWLNLTLKFAACEPLASSASADTIEILVDEPPPAARDLGPNVYDLTKISRDLAVDQEREGVRAIVAAEVNARREHWETHQAKIDPATKQFAKPAAKRTPAKRKKAA